MTAYGLRYGAVTLPLGARPLSVGRASDCDLQVDDASISRRHFELWLDGDAVFLRDCGSRNGVLVNGRRVRGTVRLEDEATIHLGRHALVVCRLGPGAAAADPAVPTRLDAPPRATAPGSKEPLTDRERQVVAWIALGHTQQATADRLGVSVKTVETHVRHAKEKLGARNRADLIAYARVAGLLPRENTEP